MEDNQFHFDAGHSEWVYNFKWKIIGVSQGVPLKYTLEGTNKDDFEYHWITVEYTPEFKKIKVMSNIIEE